MAMHTTEQGIDWNRLQRADVDRVGKLVDYAATGCTIKDTCYHYGQHKHYTTVGGEVKCITNAMRALEPATRTAIVGDALRRAVGTSLKAMFAEHVDRG